MTTLSQPKRTRLSKEEKRVLGATLVGTTVEWYDFFIYANAAAIVFASQYFGPVGEDNPQLAQLFSYASIGISFLFRPLGAVIAGWIGDKFGRRVVLMLTLGLMGLATTLVGLLPTYASIGIWAPILLMVLRILQWVSAGGEWGGAALMAVEHAPTKRRGLFGAYPQIGVPLGMLLASAILGIFSLALSSEQFHNWGWRVPFLLSFVLIFIGYYIRQRVAETPVFQELRENADQTKTPLKQLFKEDWRTVVKAALAFAGNNAAGYMVTGGFVLGYVTSTHGVSETNMLMLVSLAAAIWIFTTLFAGIISDRIGRRRTYLFGFAFQLIWSIPMFLLIDTGKMGLIVFAVLIFTIPIGLSYGPQSAMYSEMFPSRTRLSGVSISYAIGAILGGAFAPTIAQYLVSQTGWVGTVGIYLMIMALISGIAVFLIREPLGAPLTPQLEEEAAAKIPQPH
ncbi:MAG TPA: MHS family MFS transporter [Candidatus Yaniella excrementigallinarum]|nr:MHS family MFS transporter [Candidatus Yaniella excrementigallinarum]